MMKLSLHELLNLATEKGYNLQSLAALCKQQAYNPVVNIPSHRGVDELPEINEIEFFSEQEVRKIAEQRNQQDHPKDDLKASF